jgi:hypothetical protein
MGFYIEPPNGEAPLQWCKEHGARFVPRSLPPTTETFVVLRDRTLVMCMCIQQGLVGIILSPREMRRFMNDGQVSGILAIPEEEIFTHKPYLRDAEQEYVELGMWE